MEFMESSGKVDGKVRRVSTGEGRRGGGEVQGDPKAIYEDSIEKISNCVNTVNMLISSEMLIGLT